MSKWYLENIVRSHDSLDNAPLYQLLIREHLRGRKKDSPQIISKSSNAAVGKEFVRIIHVINNCIISWSKSQRTEIGREHITVQSCRCGLRRAPSTGVQNLASRSSDGATAGWSNHHLGDKSVWWRRGGRIIRKFRWQAKTLNRMSGT